MWTAGIVCVISCAVLRVSRPLGSHERAAWLLPAGCRMHTSKPSLRRPCPCALFLRRRALTHGADAASKMSAQLDPAKRYAVQAEALAPAGSSSGNSGSVAACNGGTGGSSKEGRRTRSPPATPSPAADSPAAVVSPPVGRRTWLAEGVGENNKVK